MADSTAISWTDKTFNVALGCQKVSPGCEHCYAEALTIRLGHRYWGPRSERKTMGDKYWRAPLRWQREAEEAGRRVRVFCSSMCDLWEPHETIDRERERLWPLIRATPSLDWQLLTKRPERIRDTLPPDWGPRGYPNVWLGTSIENNDYKGRADHLRAIPAIIRFVSYEPALGPLNGLDLRGIHWLIYGGESGPDFREHDRRWAREMRWRCEAHNPPVAFFYKQGAGVMSGCGTLDGGPPIHNFPEGAPVMPTLFGQPMQ